MISWIDSHCHLSKNSNPEINQNFSQMLAKAGCKGLVLGGVDPEDWLLQLNFRPQELKIARAFGLHPWVVQAQTEAQLELDFQLLRQLLPQADGLGECGLDYSRSKSSLERKKQVYWFERQLDLAEQLHKPCILHIVKAHQDAVDILKHRGGKIQGLVHGFWAQFQVAHAYLKEGFVLSVHPRILKGDNNRVLQILPRDSLVFESDSPSVKLDQVVTDPRLVLDVLQHVANIWGESLSEVCQRQENTLSNIFPCLNQSSSWSYRQPD